MARRSPASELAAQNDLSDAAVWAPNQCRLAESTVLFERLVAEHPRGPLIKSAVVPRMKVLAGGGRAEDARVGRDYLGARREYLGALLRRLSPRRAERLLERAAP